MDLAQMLEASRVALLHGRLRQVHGRVAALREEFTAKAEAKFQQQIALADSKNEIDVTVKFNVQGKNEQTEEVIADVGIEYAGNFEFVGAREQIVSFLESTEFQYALVCQVQPLAVKAMLSLMASMGMQVHSNVRLGFPLTPNAEGLRNTKSSK